MKRARWFFLGIICALGFFGVGAIGANNPAWPVPKLSVLAYRYTAGVTSNILLGYTDVTWLGADLTGTNDSSTAFAEALTLCRANGGGDIFIPPGTYRAYLDLSGGNAARCQWRGFGATWLPVSSGQTNSTLVYINNCSAGWFDTGVKFIGINFTARINGTGNGDLNYAMYGRCSAIELEHTFVTWGKAASLYGFYFQYFRDLDSTFSGANVSIACPGSGGPVSGCPWLAYMTGSGTGQSSNEMSFLRSKFNTGFNGLFIASPASSTSVDRAEFQAIATCGAQLDQDPSGAAATQVSFYSPYSENNGTAFCINSAENISILNPSFYGTGNAITASVASNLTVLNPFSTGPASTINHPSGNTDTASMNWIGGNVGPTLNLSHPGPIQANVVPGNYATASTGLSYGQGSQLHSGIVVPNGNITGNIGDTYTNLAGSTSTTFYVKETGNGTNTGWVAK